MITPNMKKFISANELSPVFFAEHLTSDGKPVRTIQDIEKSDRTLYKLEDNQRFVITLEDKQSTDYAPQWKT